MNHKSLSTNIELQNKIIVPSYLWSVFFIFYPEHYLGLDQFWNGVEWMSFLGRWRFPSECDTKKIKNATENSGLWRFNTVLKAYKPGRDSLGQQPLQSEVNLPPSGFTSREMTLTGQEVFYSISNWLFKNLQFGVLLLMDVRVLLEFLTYFTLNGYGNEWWWWWNSCWH